MNNGGEDGGTPTQPPLSQPRRNIQTETFTCEICIEPILSQNHIKFIDSNMCDHPFCSDCVVKYIEAKLEENVGEIRCPNINCQQFLEPLTYRALIGPKNFIRWCDVLCELALKNVKKSYCPNKKCLSLIVDECGGAGAGTLMKTKCPDCKKLLCFECMKPWHAGFSCKEADRYMKDPNDRAFGKLAERRQWQRCPGCRKFVELVSGCVYISCRCGVSFCYICGKRNGISTGDGNLFCQGHRRMTRVQVCVYICVTILTLCYVVFMLGVII